MISRYRSERRHHFVVQRFYFKLQCLSPYVCFSPMHCISRVRPLTIRVPYHLRIRPFPPTFVTMAKAKPEVRSRRAAKEEAIEEEVKQEDSTSQTPTRVSRKRAAAATPSDTKPVKKVKAESVAPKKVEQETTPSKKVKAETISPQNLKAEPVSAKKIKKTSSPRSSRRIEPETTPTKAPLTPSLTDTTSPEPALKKETKSPAVKKEALQAKKLAQAAAYSTASPFPTFPHPTPTEARLAHKILTNIHGARVRPAEVIASTTTAGCGASPSVLDALVRTILSQNTSDANSARAKLSMDRAYGGSDNWAKIAGEGQGKLQEAIKCGGLSVVKSKVIISILNQVYEKYGDYSLDHLHETPTKEAYKEMLSFAGVGPKTASCVLLFCLRRESFAVDTHVFRISGLLGWVPRGANRETAQAHLDVRIPGEEKYGLHILMVTHGKRCEECRAGGRNGGKCDLRKAFRRVKGEDEGVKGEIEVEVEGIERGELRIEG